MSFVILSDIETACGGGSNIRRRHFLQFGGSVGRAQQPPSQLQVKIVAWIVRVFIPLVASVREEGSPPWTSVFHDKPVNDYATSSDIAFVVLVLEHHVAKWKKVATYFRANRKPMGEQLERNVSGLLYPGGIAGAEAKERFHSLHRYFHILFFLPNKFASQNMTILSEEVSKLSKDGCEPEMTSLIGLDEPPRRAVENDIIHRVFYHLHM